MEGTRKRQLFVCPNLNCSSVALGRWGSKCSNRSHGPGL